jgi:glycylpeptide N-tetradecanoyltransferase
MSTNSKTNDSFDYNKLTDEQKEIVSETLKMNYQKLKYPMNEKQSKTWDYKFWKTQPVKMESINMVNVETIQPCINITENKLSQLLEWVDLDLTNESVGEEISSFLSDNYIEGKNDKFKLFYTSSFLRWVIKDGLMIGIRRKDTKKLIGTVSGCVKTYQISDKVVEAVEINFLCLEKKLRKIKLAEKGKSVGFFTTERYIPTPFSSVKYYHRPLNFLKLYKCGFMELQNIKELDTNINKYFINQKTPSNVVMMTEDTVSKAYELYNKYTDRYTFYEKYSLDEFKYWFLNGEYVRSYVIINEKTQEIVDFFSYYILPTVSLDDTPVFIMNAYVFTYTSLLYTPRKIFENIVIVASNDKCDIVTVANIMESDEVVGEPNGDYLVGSGSLYYNFYNLETPLMNSNQVCKIIF